MVERVRRQVATAMATHPRRVLAVVLAATVLFGVAARDVRLDNNFAALFATDSDDAVFRQEHRRRWGADDGLLVAVITGEGGAATADLVRVVERVTAEAADAVPALERVDSVATVPVLGRTAEGGIAAGPALGPTSPFELSPEQRLDLARRSGLGAANLVSADGRSFLVVGVLPPEYDSYESVVGPAAAFREAVEEVAATSPVPVGTAFSGVAYTRIAAIQLMQDDLLRLSPLASLLMALILWMVFRRAAAVLGPLLAIGSSIVVTAGVVGLAGDDLNQVTIIYPILMMGVVVSSSTHLVHRFYRERAQGRSAPEAAVVVWERLSGATAVAALTTSIGFASLVVAEMQILHEFGLYLAFGVLAASVLQLCIVPAVLVWADSAPHPSDGRDRPAGARGGAGWTERYVVALRRPWAAVGVLVLGVLVVVASVLVARTAVYDYALTDMLPADHPVSRGNATIDADLAGVVPIEIALEGPRRSFRDPDVLARMATLVDWLEDEHGIRATALSEVVAEVVELHGGDPGGAPGARFDDPAQVAAALDAAMAFEDGRQLAPLVRDDWSRARIQGFVPDRGGRAVVALRHRFEAAAERALAGTGVTARVTGEAPVAYEGMNDLTRELVHSTLLALAMIVVAVLVVFRNGWLTLTAVLPNVVPIVVALGLYRLTSDVIDPLPGIVLCIGIGLAADDTIHLVNRWREVRRLDRSSTAGDALVTAVGTLRKAMVSSSLVLVAGFLTLTLSGFPWNRQLGLLGSVVLVLALGSDLLFGVAGLSLLAWRADRRTQRLAGAFSRAA